MSAKNSMLLLAVAGLAILSVLSFRQSVGRADRFQRGQLFLSNLNPDEVMGIEVRKGEDEVTLKRQGDRFTVSQKQGYPASNSSVNRFLRDLLELALEREVGRGDDLAAQLEIEPPTADTLEIALLGAADKDMVRLRVGKSFEEGQGSYVQRLDEADAPIYLTSSRVSLSTDLGSFLDKEIVDHDRSQIVRIKGEDFELARQGAEDLHLADLPADAKAKSSEIGRLQSLLSGLRFDEVFVADDPEVGEVEFAEILELELDDGSGYVLSYATADERYFLRIRGFHTVQQVAITRDESEAELKEKAATLTRADEIEDFNAFHGSWVYEVSKWTAEKLQLRRRDLIDIGSA